MSYITDLVLFPGTILPENTKRVMEQVNAFWPDSTAPMLGPIDVPYGHKVYCSEIYGACVNHTALSEFVDHLRTKVEWNHGNGWILVAHDESFVGPCWFTQTEDHYAPFWE